MFPSLGTCSTDARLNFHCYGFCSNGSVHLLLHHTLICKVLTTSAHMLAPMLLPSCQQECGAINRHDGYQTPEGFCLKIRSIWLFVSEVVFAFCAMHMENPAVLSLLSKLPFFAKIWSVSWLLIPSHYFCVHGSCQSGCPLVVHTQMRQAFNPSAVMHGMWRTVVEMQDPSCTERSLREKDLSVAMKLTRY